MLSQNPAEPQASPLPDVKPGAGAAVPVMKPGDPIEVASTGNGTTTDPAATDGKPPRVYNVDSLA